MQKIKDPIVELQETLLYKTLLSLDESYAQQIMTFVREIAPLLATTKDHFPYYTRHDAHHGFQVVTRMVECINSSCIDSNQPEALGAPELFLLIAAAYAHDLGMTVFPRENKELAAKLGIELQPGWQTNEVLQHHLREYHSIRGGEYIERNAEKLGVPHNLVAALDLLMRAHNYSIPQLESELGSPFAAGRREIDLRQLATIVCVADAIEFSDTRVVDGVLERLSLDDGPAARISYLENMKHVCTGDSLAITDDGRVVVHGTFSDADVLALAHHTFDQMEEWIQGYSDIDHRCAIKRLKVRGDPFLRNLVFTGGHFERLGVRLSKRSVIDLIASNAVWRTNQGIALRELVQNAVEACRYRFHHSAPSDKYSPEVRVEFDRGRGTVTVMDNGCGMSKRTVLNNFLTVGSSRSKEPSYRESDYDPIARFGIGFWSVFTICDLAKVSTAAFEGYKGKPVDAQRARGFEFEVQLKELKDFTVFAPLERPCGTTVTLQLKPEVIIDEVYTALKRQLLCSMIPVILVLDSEEEFLSIGVPEVTEKDLLGVRHRAKEEYGLKIFLHKDCTSQTELAFGLAYKEQDGRATFLATPNSSVLHAIGDIRHPKTAVCGFSVPLWPSPFCIDLARVGIYHANAKTPAGFEFSIDRQQLLNNPAAQQFATDVSDLFHEGYREFLQETNSYHPETIRALQQEAAMHGGNVYDIFTGFELANARVKYSDLVCIRLIPVKSGVPFETAERESIVVDLNGLHKMDGLVFCLQGFNYPIQLGPIQQMPPESRIGLAVAYCAAQKLVEVTTPDEPAYLADPDRTFSMLFDNAPTGIACPVSSKDQTETAYFLSVRLQEVNYIEPASDILPEISGPWSGAVYWRKFSTTDNKPYFFLGRHRVLINPDSPLAAYLKNLVDEKRFALIAENIQLLKEDEAGYQPEALKEYLRD